MSDAPVTTKITFRGLGTIELTHMRLFCHPESGELRIFESEDALSRFLDENGEDYFADFEDVEERDYIVEAICGDEKTRFLLQGLHFWMFWQDAPEYVLSDGVFNAEAGGVYLGNVDDPCRDWEDVDFTQASGLDYDGLKDVLCNNIRKEWPKWPNEPITVYFCG